MAKVIANRNKAWKWNDDLDFNINDKRQKALFDALKLVSDKVNIRKTIVNCLVRYPYADGYAHYLVIKEKPLTLEHVPYGDAWQLEDYAIRGLTLADVRQQIKNRRTLDKLFAAKE